MKIMKNGKRAKNQFNYKKSLLTMNGGMKSADKPVNKQIYQV